MVFFTTGRKVIGTSRHTISVRVSRVNGFVKVVPVDSVDIYMVTRYEPKIPNWYESGGGGRHESEIGERIAKKLGKPFLLSLPEK